MPRAAPAQVPSFHFTAAFHFTARLRCHAELRCAREAAARHPQYEVLFGSHALFTPLQFVKEMMRMPRMPPLCVH